MNNFRPDSIASQVEKGIRKLENRTIKSGWNLQIQDEYQDRLPAPVSCHSSFLLAEEKG